MAQADRTRAAQSLLSYLEQNAPKVGFFQALQLLEHALPAEVPIGRAGPATDERIRIRPSLSLACPPADIERIERSTAKQPRVSVTATFLGLYGVDSPLPPAFAERLAQTAWDPAGKRVRAFLDVFHHRLYSLLYRAWCKARPLRAGQRADPLYDRLLSLVGYSSRLGLGGPTLPRLREARLSVLRPRTAVGLEAFVQLRLGYPCRVEPLRPRMVPVPQGQRPQLGRYNCVLGQTLLLGQHAVDRSKICLVIQAQHRSSWQGLVEGGEERAELERAVAEYLRDSVECELQVRADAEHVPKPGLGRHGLALGRNLWLGGAQGEVSWRWPLGRAA